MEAITSRPLLLAAVGTVANHAGQTTLYLTPLHGKASILKPLIANIRAALQHVKGTAEQFKVIDRCSTAFLRYSCVDGQLAASQPLLSTHIIRLLKAIRDYQVTHVTSFCSGCARRYVASLPTYTSKNSIHPFVDLDHTGTPSYRNNIL
jgi:hypothetical protein